MLAELMLPDQTHVRSQDWTIFFLHKDTSTEEDEEGSTAAKKKRRKRARADHDAGHNSQEEDTDALTDESSDDDGDDDDDDGGEGPPLMYVLNLVNTKQDNTVRRYVSFPNPLFLGSNPCQNAAKIN